MRKFLHYLIFVLIIGCQTDAAEPADLGHDYMPLEVSRFWVYAVDQTLYFGAGDSESTTFYYRDRITDSYIDAEGGLIFRVVREKSTDQSTWQDHSVYTLQINKNALLRSSENLATIPLVFPPSSQKTWDANVYNSVAEDLYSSEELGRYEVNGNTYENAVKVLQEQEDDQITIRDNRYEVYAKGVGMVEQYIENLTYCSRNDCLGEQIIENGRLSHLKLIYNGQY
ncbi:hypothetical protein [Echinicola rosea]|uniref:Uncharacterized protein n=1 Tax=Echinicola rosea TaxID=1807691 RepID=A0ABQ1V574_9BACT|nr:hypothetical protein [Echinicola rosea]GGF39405.1 hypothetical protein GCM10011339_29930 [Echinicola rosea]